MVDDNATAVQRWTFTAEELTESMETAHAAAAQEVGKPISLQEGRQLVLFYAQKLPELCRLCGAPSEVRWTATIYYRRFFAVQSPMEFDPVKMMFACVHLACKIEEVHEITLDKLLESTGFGADPTMSGKIASLELPLLEGIGFALLVEPKPDSTLRMLAEDLRRQLEEKGEQIAAASCTQAFRDDVLQEAEDLMSNLSIRTDAVLCWPISVVLATALQSALEGVAKARQVASEPFVEALRAVLEAGLEEELQRTTTRTMMHEVLIYIKSPACSNVVSQGDVQQSLKPVARCHRTFERLREEASELQEAQRKERKRNHRQMQGAPRAVDISALAMSVAT